MLKRYSDKGSSLHRSLQGVLRDLPEISREVLLQRVMGFEILIRHSASDLQPSRCQLIL